MNMSITTREAGEVTIVDLRGRLVVGAEGAALRRHVRDLLHDGKNKLLLNASQVEFIDSSGLGELVTALTSVQKQVFSAGFVGQRIECIHAAAPSARSCWRAWAGVR